MTTVKEIEAYKSQGKTWSEAFAAYTTSLHSFQGHPNQLRPDGELKMKAHRKLWESGLYDLQEPGKWSAWWLYTVTTEKEYQLMFVGSLSFSPVEDGMYALFFALYFADEGSNGITGEDDVIEV